jgi:hypothetical protein
MGFLLGAALLLFLAGVVMVITVVHLVFSLPLWLLLGGVALYLWHRSGASRHRLSAGGGLGGYLPRRSRW